MTSPILDMNMSTESISEVIKGIAAKDIAKAKITSKDILLDSR